MDVGTKLKRLRYFLGYSQEQMAAGVVSQSFYSRIESGDSAISPDELVELLAVHDISVVQFLKEGYEEEDRELYQDKAIEAYFNGDVDGLKTLLNSSGSQNKRDRFGVKILIAELEGKQEELDSRTKRKIRHIFFNARKLDSDILWLLLVYMNLYEFGDLSSLMHLVFGRYEQEDMLDKRTQQLMASICVSYLKICECKGASDKEVSKIEEVLAKIPNIWAVFLQKLVGVYFEFRRSKENKWAGLIEELVEGCGYQNYLKN